jgi:hypothetical protein
LEKNSIGHRPKKLGGEEKEPDEKIFSFCTGLSINPEGQLGKGKGTMR